MANRESTTDEQADARTLSVLSALHDSEERLRLAIEATGMGTYLWDHATGHADYSPEFLALYDLPPDGTLVLGPDRVPVAVIEEDRSGFQGSMAAGNIPEGDGVFKAEFRIRRSDGSIRWLMARGRTEFEGAEGMRHPSRSAGVLMDITERKRAEEALRDSEEQLDKIFNSSSNGMSFTEPVHGRILNVNDTWVRDTGISRSDAIGKTALELGMWANPDERDACLEVLERDGRVREFEATMMARGVERQFALNAEFVDLRSGRFLLWELRDITERKQTEETLRRYELLARYSRDIVLFVRREDGRILDANTAALRTYGYDREELLSHAVGDLRASDTRAVVEEQMEASDSLGLQFETVHRRNDGSTFSVEVSSVGATIGGVRTLMSVVRDITERKRAEEEIALLKHSIDVHSDAAYWMDSDGKFIYVNEVGCKSLGFEPGELIGKTILEVNPQATPERMKAVWDNLRKEGFYRSESIHQRKNSSPFPVEILTSYVRFGGKEYACGFARDITERKQKEIAFRESESRFRTLIEDSPLAIVVTRGVVTLYVNRMFQKVFALPNTEALIGQSILGCIAPQCREAIFERARRRAAGLTVETEFESTALRPDGAQFPIHATAAVVQLSDGPASLIFIMDLTERKQAEEENAKLQEQLAHAQKMESVGRLAGGVAHDFNNMLGVILGHSELAMEKVDPSDSLLGDLASIRTAAQRSADLTRQLLAFARKQTVAPKVLNLNDTVAGTLKMVRRLIGEDVELEWQPGENLGPVRIDPTQIDQILANLCVNARDAIANVGRVSIATGCKVLGADDAAIPTGVTPGEYVWLAVRDDGCGMDQLTLSHVFEPFFTTKEVGKGTGLGLATVFGIVKQNNGFIDLHSDLGHGTVFTIYLPRHVGKAGQERTDATVGKVQPGLETILLVEDEAPLLDITQRMLEKRGYEILAASTPGQALQLAREHAGKVDLLITDVVMPEMNGRDLAKSFLSLYPQAKRLFMSGYTADAIAHQGVLDEGVSFIQKPFSAKDFAAMVRKVLDAGRTEKA